MPGETRISIDCPLCHRPGAAWSATATDPTTPADPPHEDCPALDRLPEGDVTNSNDPACPTCGAVPPDPCVTSSGNEASKPHAGRG